MNISHRDPSFDHDWESERSQVREWPHAWGEPFYHLSGLQISPLENGDTSWNPQGSREDELAHARNIDGIQ